MKCPNKDCPRQVTPAEVQMVIGGDSYKKFLKFMKNYEVGKDKNKKFCPIPGCEEVIQGKKGATKVKCSKCKNDVCF